MKMLPTPPPLPTLLESLGTPSSFDFRYPIVSGSIAFIAAWGRAIGAKWIVIDCEDLLRLIHAKIRLNSKGYAYIGSIPLSDFIAGKLPSGRMWDHWNTTPRDNRKINLRETDNPGNAWNSAARPSRTNARGVTEPRPGRYQANLFGLPSLGIHVGLRRAKFVRDVAALALQSFLPPERADCPVKWTELEMMALLSAVGVIRLTAVQTEWRSLNRIAKQGLSNSIREAAEWAWQTLHASAA